MRTFRIKVKIAEHGKDKRGTLWFFLSVQINKYYYLKRISKGKFFELSFENGDFWRPPENYDVCEIANYVTEYSSKLHNISPSPN